MAFHLNFFRFVTDIWDNQSSFGIFQWEVSVNVSHTAIGGAFYHNISTDNGLAIGIHDFTFNCTSLQYDLHFPGICKDSLRATCYKSRGYHRGE